MTRFRLLVSEALRSIGANKSTTLAAAVTVLVGMFLLGVFIGLGTWLVSWSDAKKKELAVHTFIKEEATPKQVNELRVFLESDPRVKVGGITFISKAEALAIMKKRAPELTANLASNPLPPSFDVVPARGEDTEAIALAVQNAKLAAVEKVTWGKEVSRRILQLARGIQIVFLIAIIILLVASTIDIANTIRLSIFARRREVEVMKLVGATNWFVRGPFMLEGLLTGLVGSLVGGPPALPRPGARSSHDPPRRPHERGRAGAAVHVDGVDPLRRGPRDRRHRLRADAPPVPPRLTTEGGRPDVRVPPWQSGTSSVAARHTRRERGVTRTRCSRARMT